MLVHCGTLSFNLFQFDGLHFCMFGGEFILHYYGILLMLGAVAGAWLASLELKRRGHDPEMVWDLLIYLIVGGVIGARLWHVLTPTPASGLTTYYYLTHPLDVIEIWKGGLGIPGTIIGGLIALYLYVRKYKFVSFLEWTDIAAPGLALGQAIGRWGNFFNQELYGSPTTLPWGIKITDAAARVAPYTDLTKYPLDVTRFHPLFLYESILNLVNMFLLLWITRRYSNRLKQGDVFLVYLIFYPTVRFFLEFLRVDYPLIGGIDPNQVLVAAVAVLAAAALIWRHRSSTDEAVQVQSPAPMSFVSVEASQPVEQKSAARKPSSSGAARRPGTTAKKPATRATASTRRKSSGGTASKAKK
ncbi:MAG TPA: prolipoprotein diacylglyceryl transferase [Anaerolineales bacterium]|nr:prolipoprotein diacylglyceryl transferase [Anaerolineales bacterium]